MEPDELFHLEKGPESFSLTTVPIQSSESETVVFKKRREAFHVLYISDKLWTLDKQALEGCDESGLLEPVLTMLGLQSFKKDFFCHFAMSYKGTGNQDGGSCGWQ